MHVIGTNKNEHEPVQMFLAGYCSETGVIRPLCSEPVKPVFHRHEAQSKVFWSSNSVCSQRY